MLPVEEDRVRSEKPRLEELGQPPGESVLSLGLAGAGRSLGDGWSVWVSQNVCIDSSFPIYFLVSLRIVLESSSQGQRVVGMLGSVLGAAPLGLQARDGEMLAEGIPSEEDVSVRGGAAGLVNLPLVGR